MKYAWAFFILDSWNLVSFLFQLEEFGFCSKESTAWKFLVFPFLFYSLSLEYESLLTISGGLILRSSGPPRHSSNPQPPSISLGLPMFLNSSVIISLQHFLLLYKYCLLHCGECSSYFLWEYMHSLNIWRLFSAGLCLQKQEGEWIFCLHLTVSEMIRLIGCCWTLLTQIHLHVHRGYLKDSKHLELLLKEFYQY